MNSRRFFWVAPLAATLTAGCFATRNDVRLLKADIERMLNEAEANRKAEADRARTEQLRRDSVEAAAKRRFETQIANLADSLRAQGEEHSRFKATVTISLSELQAALETVQRMVGVTQAQIQAANARAEARREVAEGAASGDSGGADGPRAMYQAGIDQLAKTAWGQARGAFEELISKFPKDTLVPDAMYQIGVAYVGEKAEAKADSVWSAMVRQYPKADLAPRALYKRGMLKVDSGQTSAARTILTQVTKDYPGTEEARLAQRQLAQLPRG